MQFPDWQIPDWKRQLTSITDGVQLRREQLDQILSDLGTRGREATQELTATVTGLADRGRAVVDEVRRRVNILDLATTDALHEFLEEQEAHDEVLLETLRSELHEELQSFAAAIDDDLFEIDELDASTPSRSHGFGLDDLDADDEIDLVAYEALERDDADEMDLTYDA